MPWGALVDEAFLKVKIFLVAREEGAKKDAIPA